jgi:hypothetical protein
LTLTLEAELTLGRGRNYLSAVTLTLELEVEIGIGLPNRRTMTPVLLEELADMFDRYSDLRWTLAPETVTATGCGRTMIGR